MSGDLQFRSGTTSLGDSGRVALSNGRGPRAARAGRIHLAVGAGNVGDGGDVDVAAGETTALVGVQGGKVKISAGIASAGA